MKLLLQAVLSFGVAAGATTGYVIVNTEPIAGAEVADTAKTGAEHEAETDSSDAHAEPAASDTSHAVGDRQLADHAVVQPDSQGTPDAAAADSASAELLQSIRYLSRIFANMRPDDAAGVLRHLPNEEVAGILRFFNSRVAAGILSGLSEERAAEISRLLLHGCEKCAP